jgi:chemotaxis protein histidine kinase CheA
VTTSVEKQVNGTPVASHAEPRPDPRALAEAEAIRARAATERQALLAAAEGEKAFKLQQAEQLRLENDKQRMVNERNAVRLRREKAVEEAKIAEANTKKEAAERASREAREADDARRAEEQQQADEVAQADDRWRKYALTFYTVCAVVALPVQVAAFYNPHAIWLMAAPLMLEGGAWVVLKGAAAAVASHRPHWHYRLIAWLLAFIAAGINLWHGLNAFDPATAIGTAFASIAGPGVWDLHEHGRIRKRDGVLTRAERRAAEKAAKAEATAKAAEEKRRAAEKEAAAKAAEEAAKQLAETRATKFPKVWDHALSLAADLGETTVTEAIWKRAKLDVDGALPGESAEVFRMRNAAEMRVDAARQKRSVNGSSQQVASQVLGPKKPRVYNPPARPGRRTKGDTPKQSPGARRQASIAAKNAAKKDPS